MMQKVDVRRVRGCYRGRDHSVDPQRGNEPGVNVAVVEELARVEGAKGAGAKRKAEVKERGYRIALAGFPQYTPNPCRAVLDTPPAPPNRSGLNFATGSTS
jgi:hypothetical protein